MIKGYQTQLLDSYAKIREIEAKNLRERKNEIQKLHPEILDVDNQIQKLSINMSISILHSKDPEKELEKYKEKITDLRMKKCELLVANGYDPEFLSLHYQCPKCKDTGFIGTNKCSCYKEKMIKLYYKNSLLQGTIKDKNFNSFNINLFSTHKEENQKYSPRKNMEIILNYVRNDYIPNFSSINSNLLFYGNPGSGKSFLSYCIAKELLDNGYLVVYKTSDELITDLKDIRFNNNSYLHELLLNCDLLIIDDLGAEQKSDFSTTEFFNLLNKRLLMKKKMINSTNLFLPNITQTYSERIYSRLVGEFKLFKFYSDDIRIFLNLKNNK